MANPADMDQEQQQAEDIRFHVEIGEPWTSRIGSIQARVRIAATVEGEVVVETNEVLAIDDMPSRASYARALVSGVCNSASSDIHARALTGRLIEACTTAMDALDETADLVAETVGTEIDLPEREVFRWGGEDGREPVCVPISAPAVMYGDPACGKSTLAMHMALSMSVAGYNVAWIDMENDPEDVKLLAGRVARGMGLAKVGLLLTRARQMSLGARLDSMRRAFRDREIDYVVVDSATMAADGELSSAEVSKAYFEALHRIAGEAGSLTICHTPKHAQGNSGAAAQAGPLGSRVWTSYPRLVMSVSEDAEGNNAGISMLGMAAGRKPLLIDIVKSSGGDHGYAAACAIAHTDTRASVCVQGILSERASTGAMPMHDLLDRLYERLSTAANGWTPTNMGSVARELQAGHPRPHISKDVVLTAMRSDSRFLVRQEGRARSEVIRTASSAGDEGESDQDSQWHAWYAAALDIVTGEMTKTLLISTLRERLGVTRVTAREIFDRVDAGSVEGLETFSGDRNKVMVRRVS